MSEKLYDTLHEVLNRHLMNSDDIEQVAKERQVWAGDLDVDELAQMVASAWFANLHEEIGHMVDTLVERGYVKVRE